MLSIDSEVVEAIIAHARRDHPDEACGVVAGPTGSDRPLRLVPMVNAERSPTFYRFDSLEQLAVWRGDGSARRGADRHLPLAYRDRGVSVSHRHRVCGEPAAHYVVISTREADTVEIRSFRIVDGEVTEEEVQVTGRE